MSFQCKQCSDSLNWSPQGNNPYTQYCVKCKTCPVCGDMLAADDLIFNVKHELESPFRHCRCLAVDLYESLSNKKTTVEISDKELDLLNYCRLGNLNLDYIQSCLKLHTVNSELSIETNQQTVSLEAPKLFIDKSVEEKYIHLRMMESVIASMYVLLKKENRQAIELKLSAKEREKYLKPVSNRGEQKSEQCPKCKKHFTITELKAHKIKCLADLASPVAKIEKKRLNNREKAIKAFTDIGIPLSIAETMVKQEMDKLTNGESVQ